MNTECLMQWNLLKKETTSVSDFDLKKLEQKIEVYLQENQGTGEDVVRIVLRGIREAIKHREDEDKRVRDSARKLLASCYHTLDKARENADHLDKTLAEAEERELESRKIPEIISLDNDFQLEEVLTIRKLTSVGKALDICVSKRDTALGYLGEVEAGKTKLWVLLKQEKPYALLQIDMEDNEVQQFSASENDDPVISFELAVELLNKLDITADDTASFVHVGAFSKFKDGRRPDVMPVFVNGQEMWIWLYEEELIIAVDEYHDGNLSWSRFELTREEGRYSRRTRPGRTRPWRKCPKARIEWESNEHNHMSLGMLFEVVRQNPHILERFRAPPIIMKKHCYSDRPVIGIFKQAEACTSVPGLCREHGMSSATF